ncbi:eCIS core domain-containing protein [Pedobacter caeni]|uniref:eCIS core domain-containing protein n=1 Tax=Pedobacter caeni TaxID=288992 RepID=A0A1M4U5H6_9SPHI|nr:DUF4157 domain-containing protein [Pedobacter caeni]SHE51896.1 protein of unknown function [Pedobacter caeni]
MKAAEAKSVATPAKANSSFFNKGADHALLSDSTTQTPFFRKQNDNAFFVQTKLTVGQPDDKYEQEADQTADKVLQRLATNEAGSTSVSPSITPFVQTKCEACEKEVQKKEAVKEEEVQKKEEEIRKKEEEVQPKEIIEEEIQKKEQEPANPVLQRKPIFESNAEPADEGGPVQRKCQDCEQEEEKKIQKKSEKSSTDISPTIENSLYSTKGGGRSLPAHMLTQMEGAFGADFSKVRIHDNSTAAQLNKDLNAQAFAHGNDIYFNSGKYNTNSISGQHLLAHELTHTIQQGGIQRKEIPPKSSHGPSLSPALNTTDPVIAKKEEEEEDGFLVSKAKEGLWAILKEASPEIHDIFRYKGFMNWAKERVSSFVSSTVNTLSAPIRIGAGIITQVKANFNEFKVWMGTAVERLKKGDCTPFAEASLFISNILEGITGPALEKLKEFLAPIKSFIDKVWNDIGKPIWDFVSMIFGTIWDGIKWVADKIWTDIKRIASFFADIWHWFANAIGFEGDDQNSLWEQIKRKVSDLWEAIKAKLAPYKTQLMVLGGIILLLSPVGPFIMAAAAITGIMYAASKIRHYLQDKEAIIKERGIIQGVLIPELFNALHSVGSFLKSKASAISGALKNAVDALNGISKDLGETVLAAINAVVDWLAEKFEAMSDWAEMQLGKLITTLEDAFKRIVKFLQPITDILKRVGAAIADYYKLPFLVMDALFHKIPKCIRDKIIAFLSKYIFKHIPILREIKDVEAAWKAMEKKAMQIIDMLFIDGNLLGALWEIFNLLLDAMKFPKELALKVYNKAFDVFDSIVEQPRVFFVNMLKTVKLGLIGFFDRKWKHLKDGFTTWLFDAVKGSPVYVPKEFTFSEIFKMLGSMFSVGMEKVYKSIEKKRGKPLADKVRKWITTISKGAAKAWGWLKALHENSLDETIEMIKAKGAELLDVAIDAIVDWIVTKVIEKISAKIVTMLDPTGVMAVVNSLIAFYNAVETAIEKAREILEFVESVLDNIGEVMAGALVNAALVFENNLEKAIPLFLEFLANQLSMGKLGHKIKEMAKKAGEWIDEKIDWLVDKALQAGDWLVETGKAAIKKIAGWLGLREEFTADDEPHAIYFSGTESSAEMMVESTPMTMKKLFELKAEEFELLKGGEKIKKEAAMASAKDIYKEIKSGQTKVAKEKDEKEKTKLESDLNRLFKLMIPHLKIMGIGRVKAKDLPVTKVTYEPKGGKAGKVIADPLTKESGNTKGSRPSVDPDGWTTHIMTIANYAKTYVRLHLLSEKLHGPGNETWNLTPGAKSENGLMEKHAEKSAKEITKKNTVMWYESEVTSYRSQKELSDFAEGIRVSYGFQEQDEDGTWKRINQASYSNIFPVTEPVGKGEESAIPSIDTMAADYWSTLKEGMKKGPTRETFRTLVAGRSEDGGFKSWEDFSNSNAYSVAKESYPAIEGWLRAAVRKKLLRNVP